MKSARTNRLGTVGKVKGFGGNFLLGWTFEMSRPTVLVVSERRNGERTRKRGRYFTLRNRQMGKLRLLTGVVIWSSSDL